MAAIAPRQGVSRETVRRDLASISGQQLLTSLVAEREEQFRRLYAKSLDQIELALEAVKRGRTVDERGKPDLFPIFEFA